MAAYPGFDTPSLAGSKAHGSHHQGWTPYIRSTNTNGNTEGEAYKGKKDAARKESMMDDLIIGTIRKKRIRSHSAPNLITGGKGEQTTSTSSTGPTISSPGKPTKGSRNISKANSLIDVPVLRRQIPLRPPNTLKLPTGPFLTRHHRLLKMKLTPLAAVESQLLQELSTPAMEEDETRCWCPLGRLWDHKELIIRPLRGWEDKFGRLRIGTRRWLEEEPKVRCPDDPRYIVSAW